MISFVQAVGMNSSREDCPRRWKRKNPRISVSRVVVCSEWMNGSAVTADSLMAKRRRAYFASTWKKIPRRMMRRSNFHTLVEALLQAPSHRTFITMWHDEDDL